VAPRKSQHNLPNNYDRQNEDRTTRRTVAEDRGTERTCSTAAGQNQINYRVASERVARPAQGEPVMAPMSWRRKPTLADKIAKRIGSLRVEFKTLPSGPTSFPRCERCGDTLFDGPPCYSCQDANPEAETP
jgi:hypothetical protein